MLDEDDNEDSLDGNKLEVREIFLLPPLAPLFIASVSDEGWLVDDPYLRLIS